MQRLQLCLVVAVEAVKVSLVILLDDLLDEQFLDLRRDGLVAFPDQHDEILQEVGLLDIELFFLDAERIHRDRMLLGITDILKFPTLKQ